MQKTHLSAKGLTVKETSIRAAKCNTWNLSLKIFTPFFLVVK